MRAVVQDAYGAPGEVLRVREIAMPAVGDNDVLVRVRAASVHPDVWHTVTGIPYVLRLMGNGLRRPKFRVPGTDLAGVVESWDGPPRDSSPATRCSASALRSAGKTAARSQSLLRFPRASCR
jgi:NADPH:quinone reductase-like Zn-dependent oxidoreductase